MTETLHRRRRLEIATRAIMGVAVITSCALLQPGQSKGQVVTPSQGSQIAQSLGVPSDISIIPPASGTSPAEAAFLGKWAGSWGGTLPSVLVVQQVDPSGAAQGMYFWGTNTVVPTPGSIKIRAHISNGTLSWGGGSVPLFEFRVGTDGSLNGERYINGAQQGAVSMMRF